MRRLTWTAALAAAAIASSGAEALVLARDEKAAAVIVLAPGAIPSEKTAASELATYLGKATGARFDILPEGDPVPPGPALFVGPTAEARRMGIDPERMGAEEWTVRSSAAGIVIAGGRPRGTLYGVYHFLEDELGVRWWNAFEETVPRRATLRIGHLARRGQPVFASRDFSGADGPAVFLARSRVNGAASHLTWGYGGYEGFATPWHVHSFYLAVPPETYFAPHPRYFSERAGLRSSSRLQLCLTNPDLPAVVASVLAPYAEAAEAEAKEMGAPPLRLLDFSQNDWGGRCRCEACQAATEREGSDSGPLLALVNDVAARVVKDHPEALVTTLAYTFTFLPPAHVRGSDHVVVRLSGYGKRDFSKGILAPENALFRKAVEDWSRAAPRLWIWDYGVIFFEGAERNLPIPSYRYYADDFRFYRDHGVSGILVQHEFPIASDLRDLKVWLYLKLMENPDLDQGRLIREFTDGYYGRAGRWMRRYLRALEAAADRKPGYIGAESEPDAFRYIDAEFVTRAGALFDRAEASVANDPLRARRVRHARLTLDYAALRLGARIPDRRAVADRYRRTWDEQIDLRTPAGDKDALRAEVDDEIAAFLREP